MKKFMNASETLVADALRGVAAVHTDVVRVYTAALHWGGGTAT